MHWGMPTLPREVIGDAYANRYCWRTLEELTEVGNRMAGSTGEAHGAAVLGERFETAGARDIEITEFEIPGWWRGSSRLRIEGPWDRTFEGPPDIVALPGSPRETVAGPIVDVGAGLPTDFAATPVDGRIALVSSQNPPDYGRAINRIEKYVRAEHAGAAAVIYANAVDGAIPPTGAVGFARGGTGSIPALGVSHEVGRRIQRYGNHGDVRGELMVEARTGRAASRTVQASVGPDTRDAVLVSAHVDAHDIADGVRDNGVGCALVAETGRLLKNVDLDTRVCLLAFGAEETGLYGSTHWASSNDLNHVKCQINLDGLGYARDFRVNGTPTVTGVFEASAGELGVPIRTGSTPSPFNDRWPFIKEGVPSATCRSAPAERGRVIRYGHVEWGHTHADTLDKIDPRDLRELAIQVANGVVKLAGDACELTRESPESVRDRLADDVVEYLDMSGRVDWSPLGP